METVCACLCASLLVPQLPHSIISVQLSPCKSWTVADPPSSVPAGPDQSVSSEGKEAELKPEAFNSWLACCHFTPGTVLDHDLMLKLTTSFSGRSFTLKSSCHVTSYLLASSHTGPSVILRIFFLSKTSPHATYELVNSFDAQNT